MTIPHDFRYKNLQNYEAQEYAMILFFIKFCKLFQPKVSETLNLHLSCSNGIHLYYFDGWSGGGGARGLFLLNIQFFYSSL